MENKRQSQCAVPCTYCSAVVKAVKSCLQCESSMCSKHLKKHNTNVDHVLVGPIKSFEHRKCLLHKEILKYYCPKDYAYLCASCLLVEHHKDHQVVFLHVASEQKKEKLKSFAKDLPFDRWKLEKKQENLQQHQHNEKGKASALNQRIKELFREVRKKVNALEASALAETSRQEKQISLSVSDLVRQLEVQKGKLSTQIDRIEELLQAGDPLSLLREIDYQAEYINVANEVCAVKEAEGLDEGIVSQILQAGIVRLDGSRLLQSLKFEVIPNSQVLLDLNSAGNNLIISEDLCSATYTIEKIDRPDVPERFKCSQVLSECQFTTGRHYCEVDVSAASEWLIGVAAHSIERKKYGSESYFGSNDKSWGLGFKKHLTASHNTVNVEVAADLPLKAVGVYLDYEAGHLAFIQLSDPVRCLYAFTATFDEPLHAAIILNDDSSITILN